MKKLSCSLIRPVNNSATAAGTKVTERIIAATERDDDGQGHRVEHFSFNAGESKDRKVDDGDDE